MKDAAMDWKRRLDLFPDTTSFEGEANGLHLTIGGCSLLALAEEFGTPLYVYDRVTLEHAVDTYQEALKHYYPGETGLTYAGKAYLCTAIAQWTQQRGLYLDCSSAGELHIARKAGTRRDRLLLHGVNKSSEDLQAAADGAGILVVDNLTELERTISLTRKDSREHFPSVWLRWRPGVAVDTHRHTQTGQEDSKFGMNSEEINQAVLQCQEAGLRVSGIHFHQGSHFHDPEPLGQAIALAMDMMVELRTRLGWLPETLCPGGGWGVAYHESELPHPAVEAYVRYISEQVQRGCEARRMPLPCLVLEPGRSLVARAGVALYRVGTVKQTAQRRWLLLDGGLADNPRPALYGTRYSALPVAAPGRPSAGPAWLGGPYCESGDVLIQRLPLPLILEGELIAVPVSGAYQLSMGSNYNGARKPAVVMVEAGSARLIQRRENLEDLVRRDLGL
jgi:diaminopimelate decarboxylase